MTRRILVCGGRDYAFSGGVYRVLDSIHGEAPIEMVIQGGCPTGADKFARNWANDRGIELKTEKPEWDRHGKAAGPLRNQRMLDVWSPDLVIAFPGGRGTQSMCDLAEKAGVKVTRILF